MRCCQTLTDAFREEWKLYERENRRRKIVYRFQKTDLDFDPLAEGEVRLMVDVDPPLMVYVEQRCGAFKWTVIPISPFGNPGSSCEALIGNKVYQFWNRQDVPAWILGRSLKNEDVEAEERAEIERVRSYLDGGTPLPDHLLPALGEAVRDLEDPRLRYLSLFELNVCKLLRAQLLRLDVGISPWIHVLPPEVIAGVKACKARAMAAADDTGTATVALFMDQAPASAAQFKERAFECSLVSEFTSMLPDDDERVPLVYTWTKKTPVAWKNTPVTVAAYVEKTGELFGRGTIDVAGRRIVINDFEGLSLKTKIDRVSDILLVVAPDRGEG